MKRLTKIELSLVGLILIGITINIVFPSIGSKILIIALFLLNGLYLFGSYFVFKEKDSARNIILPSIFFGLVMSVNLFAITFRLLRWEGSGLMLLVALMTLVPLVLFFVISTFIAKYPDNKGFYRNAFIRLGWSTAIVAVFHAMNMLFGI